MINFNKLLESGVFRSQKRRYQKLQTENPPSCVCNSRRRENILFQSSKVVFGRCEKFNFDRTGCKETAREEGDGRRTHENATIAVASSHRAAVTRACMRCNVTSRRRFHRVGDCTPGNCDTKHCSHFHLSPVFRIIPLEHSRPLVRYPTDRYFTREQECLFARVTSRRKRAPERERERERMQVFGQIYIAALIQEKC